MQLGEAKIKFLSLRHDESRIHVRRHAHADYPKREFTLAEVKTLAMTSRGVLRDNHVDSPAPDSFVWWCRDGQDRQVQLTVKFEMFEGTGEVILVISAYRRV